MVFALEAGGTSAQNGGAGRDARPLDVAAWVRELVEAQEAALAHGYEGRVLIALRGAPVPTRVTLGDQPKSIDSDLFLATVDAGTATEWAPIHDWAEALLAAAPRGEKLLALVTYGAGAASAHARRQDRRGGSQNLTRREKSQHPLQRVQRRWALDPERLISVARKRRTRVIVAGPEAPLGEDTPLPGTHHLPWATEPRWRHDDTSLVPRQQIREDRAARFRSAGCGTAVGSEDAEYAGSVVPSGFGDWTLSRVAAATGGEYVLMRAPDPAWLDIAPLDEALRTALAPSVEPRRDWLTGQETAPYGRVVREVIAHVQDAVPTHLYTNETFPWAWDPRRESGLQLWDRRRDRRAVGVTLARDVLGSAETARAVLKQVRRAIEIHTSQSGRLAAALRTAPSGPSRAHADALLVRFRIELSAFHLAAYAAFLETGLKDGLIPSDNAKGASLTLQETVLLSDLLPGLGETPIASKREEQHIDDVGGAVAGWKRRQRCKLWTRAPDPRYRSRRGLGAVIADLDPRLLEPLDRVVDAANDVFKLYRRTLWGATVYYTAMHTPALGRVSDAPTLENDRMLR